MNRQKDAEVEWYTAHGKYPERIARDSMGQRYVIGDWSWNLLHTDKPEVIEPLMGLAPPESTESST